MLTIAKNWLIILSVNKINYLFFEKWKDAEMKLQIALDTCSYGEVFHIVDTLRTEVDIVEIGTPLLLKYGLELVSEVKRVYPELEVLSDGKTMDAGKYEADLCFDSGADIATVLAVSQDSTIKGVVESARNHGRKVLADMINSASPRKRTEELLAMGVDFICAHNATDVLDMDKTIVVLNEISSVVPRDRLVIAGGINPSTAKYISGYHPYTIIVGNAIVNAADMAQMARDIKSEFRV